MSELPSVVIVGRPNVGKSTLFNRLIGKRKAITLDTPGVTRDPISEVVEWGEQRLRLIDTGGLGGEDVIDLADRVHQHTLRAIEGATAAIVVFDARAGVGPLDRDTVETVQRMEIPALYVANKADGPAQLDELAEFCRLGIDPPLPLSAEHDAAFGVLKDATVELLATAAQPPSGAAGASEAADATAIRVAIVGRPNVGKSSLLNAIAGTDLALVDHRPGTTRDVVDARIERAGRAYLLLDTAGMRRASRVDAGVERISVGRSVNTIRRADVVLVMIEPVEGMTDQDARIARLAWQEGKALVLGLNKIDLLGVGQSFESLHRETLRRYPTLAPALMTFLSALQGRGIDRLFDAIVRAATARTIDMRTVEVNRIVAAAAERRQPPIVAGRRLKILYAAQTGRRPPAVTLFVNRIGVPTDYTRFLERCFREAMPLDGTPLRLHFSRRASHGPGRA